MRMMRRAGLLGGNKAEPTLADLFADMTLVGIKGINYNVRTTTILSIPDLSAAPRYVFSFNSGHMAINKIIGITKTLLFQSSSLFGNIGTVSGQGPIYIYYANSASDASTKVFGCTLAMVSFPHYKESQIDSLLSNISIATRQGRESNTLGSVSRPKTSIESASFVFAAVSVDFSVSASLNPMEAIFKTNYVRPYALLASSSTYYYLANASSEGKSNIGRVFGGSLIVIN